MKILFRILLRLIAYVAIILVGTIFAMVIGDALPKGTFVAVLLVMMALAAMLSVVAVYAFLSRVVVIIRVL